MYIKTYAQLQKEKHKFLYFVLSWLKFFGEWFIGLWVLLALFAVWAVFWMLLGAIAK